MSRYDDIITLPHHVSPTRRPMSAMARAAQFAPFAALHGHDEAIAETARLTDGLIELTPDEQASLSRRLIYATERHCRVTILHFVPDPMKEGGCYRRSSGVIKRMDECERAILLTDGTSIPLHLVADITGGY